MDGIGGVRLACSVLAKEQQHPSIHGRLPHAEAKQPRLQFKLLQLGVVAGAQLQPFGVPAFVWRLQRSC